MSCKHSKIEYLEWKIFEDRGHIFGNCFDCGSTVAMKPKMILLYKDWQFSFAEANKLINHLMDNLEILETLKQEVQAYYKEGVLSEKEMELGLEMLKKV